jgi:lipoate-protein ligase A
MDAFRAEMLDGIADIFGELIEYRLTAGDWEAVERLANEKYKSWDWNFGRSPEFSVRHTIRLDSGIVDAQLIVKNGIIKDIELADQKIESSSGRNVIKELIGRRFELKSIEEITF